MRRPAAILALSLLATCGGAYAESAAVPVRPALPAPKISLKQFMEKLPGTWSGTQYTQSPKGQIMTVSVKESYRWEKAAGDEPPVLLGDLSYTVHVNGKERVFTGTSRTWIDKAGKGHAEVEQSGVKTRYVALINVDTLVFAPEGELEKPRSMTTVRFVPEKGVEAMEVRGFQSAPDGPYLMKGLLKREVPVVAGPGK